MVSLRDTSELRLRSRSGMRSWYEWHSAGECPVELYFIYQQEHIDNLLSHGGRN